MKIRRLVLVGGFLGAGKTTLIGKMVQILAQRGSSAGVITNDQAGGLVDTASIRSGGASTVAEVAGGCFCCRLEELVKILQTDESGAEASKPDVVIAEPVGSCTDLVSTVLLPLERIYQVPFVISPLSVVVDARRALSSLGGRRTPGDFSKDVGYIYRKQLEEAEVIVVNKSDLMAGADLEDLLKRLAATYPAKAVHVISARSGAGVEAWLDQVLSDRSSPAALMDVDYARYGAGEALLGWFNAEFDLSCPEDGRPDGDAWLVALAESVSARLDEKALEVAHFKMALEDDFGNLGTVNKVMSGAEPESSRRFDSGIGSAKLTINLRAEGDPEVLKAVVLESLAAAGPAQLHRAPRTDAAFRPGQPVPTAKVASLAAV